ncbi:MAG: O-antigen ligase family protein [Cyclobacteriaceae bacterium]|nr:O-antigen ligase family protein [Cyclobacteriaceae bacterium]
MNWRKTISVFSPSLAIVSLPVSMAVCHAALILFLVNWLLEGRWLEKKDIAMRSPLVWSYLAFFALHLISIIYSANAAGAWFSIEQKSLFFILPIAMITSQTFTKEAVRPLYKIFVFTCLACSVICVGVAVYQSSIQATPGNFDSSSLQLYQELNPSADTAWMFFSYAEMASGIGIHPTYLAMYVVFSILSLIHLYGPSFAILDRWKQLATAGLGVYFSLFVILLSSRIVTLALIIILSVTGFNFMKSLEIGMALRLVTSFVMISFFVLIILINPVTRYRNIQEPFTADTYLPHDGTYAFSTGIRKSLWWVSAASVFNVNPLIGTGTGDVTATVKEKSDQEKIENVIGSYDPHNQFLYTQIALGLAGLVTLLFCLYYPAWVAFHHKDTLYLGFITLFTMACLTESVLESQKGIVFFAIFNSLLFFPYSKLPAVSSKKILYA